MLPMVLPEPELGSAGVSAAPPACSEKLDRLLLLGVACSVKLARLLRDTGCCSAAGGGESWELPPPACSEKLERLLLLGVACSVKLVRLLRDTGCCIAAGRNRSQPLTAAGGPGSEVGGGESWELPPPACSEKLDRLLLLGVACSVKLARLLRDTGCCVDGGTLLVSPK